MQRDRIERWLPSLSLVVAGALLVWDAVGDAGLRPTVAIALVILGVGAWWLSPLRRGRHLPHDTAQRKSAAEDLIVYWKPGCTYCMRLFATLDSSERERVYWVNVWRDHEAAAFVADHNDGNVLTPTVMTGAGRRLPMTPEAIRSHLAEHQDRRG